MKKRILAGFALIGAMALAATGCASGDCTDSSLTEPREGQLSSRCRMSVSVATAQQNERAKLSQIFSRAVNDPDRFICTYLETNCVFMVTKNERRKPQSEKSVGK